MLNFTCSYVLRFRTVSCDIRDGVSLYWEATMAQQRHSTSVTPVPEIGGQLTRFWSCASCCPAANQEHARGLMWHTDRETTGER
eukprot:11302-Eustigmatos_ZCMA.PRE.1